MAISMNRRLFLMLGCFILASFCVGIISVDSSSVRHILFLSLFVTIITFALLFKHRIIAFLIFYLAIMGFLRRLLIPIAGWTSFDPLLILGPCITILLVLLIFWEIKKESLISPVKPDKLMIILISMGVLHMFNPFSGSPLTGIISSIYIIIPWLWYLIAFYLITSVDIKKIFNVIEVTGTLIALYGINQSFNGLLPFEMEWVEISGYAALSLGDTIRAIGTFPSAIEFVYFTMITFMIAFIRMIVNRNIIVHLPVVTITLFAIFFASSRTVMIFMSLAIIIVLILTRSSFMGKVTAGSISLITFSIIWYLLPFINPSWFGVAGPAVEHMISGLIDPLSEDDTGIGHIERFVEGLGSLFSNPVGYGIASITTAANKSNSTIAMSTEVDISNMIVAMGIGGIIYFIIIISTIYRSLKLISIHKKIEFVIPFGIFIASLGQWINGGFYLVTIIIWLLVGWTHKQYFVYRGETDAFGGR